MAKPFGNIKYEEMFIGQIPPNQIQDKIDPDGWGDRVKVRIPNYHSQDIPDDKLPWAIVERPTSQGNACRGSTGLCGGEWVRGYFIDGIPIICTVLSRGTYENNISLQEAKQKKSTGFKNITRFNSYQPHSGQVIGGDKPITPAQPTKQEFNGAKDSMTNSKTSDTTSTGIPSEPKVTTNPDGTVSVTTYKYDSGVEGGVEAFTRVGSPDIIDIGRREQSMFYSNETSRLSGGAGFGFSG